MIGSRATLPGGRALALSAAFLAGGAAGRTLMALDERPAGESPLPSSRRAARWAGTPLFTLQAVPEVIRSDTNFHWWPQTA